MNFVSGNIRALDDRFIHALRDVYYAEKEIASVLPAMIEWVGDANLKSGFELQLGQTRTNIERIEKLFAMQSVEPKQLESPEADSILEETSHLAGDTGPMDATTIAAVICAGLLQQTLNCGKNG
jgi:ferritin-like metal-binding protein YciE